MGFDMTASAPEEGRKCWLKVSYNGMSRMVEWNTACCTFKDMNTKVRKMFSLNDKLKLVYSYKTSISGAPADILMSSDEELNTALRRLDGEVLLVNLSIRRKEKKGVLCRALRAVKASRPGISQFVRSLPATALAHAQAVPLGAITARLRASAQACCAAHSRHANANPNAAGASTHACRMRLPKVLLCFLVLLAAVVVARYRIKHMQENYFSNGYYGDYNGHVTILAAAYGGRDVTRQAQEFHNAYHRLQASNHIFGDPLIGNPKYLHVVFQRTGMSEVFSQSIHESDALVELYANKDDCRFPVEAVVSGKSIRVLGVMYDGAITTCAARRLLSAGHFNSYTTYVKGKSFGVDRPSGQGAFTMAYLKNNKIQMVTAKEGQAIVL